MTDHDPDKTIKMSPDPASGDGDDVTILIPQDEASQTGITGTMLRNADEEIMNLISGEDTAKNTPADIKQLALSDMAAIYSTGEKIGSGGQGIVHSGSDPALNREVAIKSLRKELLKNQEEREKFIREARLTAMLDHPAIIPIYNLCGGEDGQLYLAMKMLRGISLKNYLAKTIERYANSDIRNFDEESALINRLGIFIKVCEAMEYVHSKNIIHCDLKPENIMLGQYGEVYIIDWGIAREFGIDAPSPQKIMGTPRYTSPENLLSQPCDARSDIYSMGVILFELVTLNQAFSGESASEIVEKVKQGNFNDLHHNFAHPIPADLAAIVRKATAMVPDDRYLSINDLTEDIRRYLRGAEVSANPDSGIRKVVRWAKRNRRKAAVTAVSAVAALTAFAVLGIFAANMRDAENEHMQDSAIDRITAEVVQTAVKLDRTLNHAATLLGVLNADISMLLDLNRPAAALGNPAIISGNASVHIKPDKSIRFVPDDSTETYFTPGQALDLSRATYIRPGKSDPEKTKHILRCIRPVVSRMRRTVLKSNPEMVNASTAELIAAYRELKLPVSFCYFTLNNGLHVVYPGNNDVKNGFDGRTRPWFKNAAGRGVQPVWTLPYITAFKQENPVISCSMEIVGANEKIHGVSGVDIPMQVIENMLMENPGRASFVMNRIILNQDGDLIAAVTGDNTGFKLIPPGQKEWSIGKKRLSIIRSSRYGRIIREENGKDILWVFSLIPSAQWIYIEKIDLDKLLLFSRVSRQ